MVTPHKMVAPDQSRNAPPVRLGLGLASGVGSAGQHVIDKSHVVSDKYGVFDGYTFTNERVAGNLTILANLYAFLDFYESAYSAVVSDLAAIQIDEIIDFHVRAQLDVRSNSLQNVFWCHLFSHWS